MAKKQKIRAATKGEMIMCDALDVPVAVFRRTHGWDDYRFTAKQIDYALKQLYKDGLQITPRKGGRKA